MVNLLKEFFSVRGTKKYVALATILTILNSIVNTRVTMWISIIVSNTNDTHIVTKYLNMLIVGLLATVLMSFIGQFVNKKSMHLVYAELCNRAVDKILTADYDAFTKYSAGQIQSVVNGIYNIAGGGKFVINIFYSLANFIAVSISICLIDIRLIIPIFVIYTLGLLAYEAIWKRALKLDREADDLVDRRNDEISKIISGFAEIRTNNTQQYHRDLIRSLNTETTNKYVSKVKVVISSIAVINTINAIIITIVVLYSIIAIPQGMVSSMAMSMVVYAQSLLGPLLNIIDMCDGVSESAAKAARYRSFMDIDKTIEDGAIELESFDSSIKFKDVSFSYNKSDIILNRINLSIRKGEKIGICGNSGGGKSTLLKLIPRLYEVSDGSISVDGIDIRDLTQNSLRSKIGFVHQSNYIFKGTIYDNIVYGTKNRTENEVIDVCKKACIYDFIISLPDGFKTDVGPNGLKLSGGQQQRIALARIFLSNPDIILLDEATSALDNESEAIIQESLSNFKDKTIIAVAHRLSTIQNFDRIVVINEHQIVEEGSHEELMDMRGIYYNLYTAKD